MQGPLLTLRFKNLILCLGSIIIFGPSMLLAQKRSMVTADTVYVKAGLLVILKDTFFVAASDTILIDQRQSLRLREDPYARSKNFYDSLAVRSGKNRMMRELYKLMIRDKNPVVRTRKNEKPREDYFDIYKGKVIRNITTMRIPILGGDVNDTACSGASDYSWLIDWHPQTKEKLVKGKGLVKPGMQVKKAALADFERLVREMKTIRDAKLYILPVNGTDSIDLLMATQDEFPVRLNMNVLSEEHFIMRVTDKNITGAAVEASITYENNPALIPERAFSLNIRQSNLFNRFFDGQVYAFERDSRKEQGIEINRDFLSEMLPNSGGLYFRNSNDKANRDSAGSTYHLLNGGTWYGRAISSGGNRVLMPTIAVEIKDYTRLPASEVYDMYSFENVKKVLSGLNFFHRSYLRSTLVKAYGTSEYIPVGYKLNITGGYEVSPSFERNYLAANVEFANYINDVGYLAIRMFNSRFFIKGRESDKIISLHGNYYSPLLKLGRTRWRQFVYSSYKEIQKPFSEDAFTLNGPWEDAGDNKPGGSRFYSVGAKTVVFMPWYVYGFRFSLYDGADFQWLRNAGTAATINHPFPSYRLGLNLQNDHLTYPSFSFQAEWYPSVNGYETYFSFSFKTFVVPLFNGLQVGRPFYFDGLEE